MAEVLVLDQTPVVRARQGGVVHCVQTLFVMESFRQTLRFVVETVFVSPLTHAYAIPIILAHNVKPRTFGIFFNPFVQDLLVLCPSLLGSLASLDRDVSVIPQVLFKPHEHKSSVMEPNKLQI